ncbi:MAG TPA: NUDIX domain-containing protein [Clostridia bacterium]
MDKTEDWDVYDASRKPLGRTHARGVEMAPGDYHLVVQIWICNGRGEYLIQKRSVCKDIAPGLWATTAGSAVAGEDSHTACIRETQEEIGLTPDMARASVVRTFIRDDSLIDVWWIRQDTGLSNLVLQKEEVDDVRWATPDEIRAMVHAHVFWPYDYLDCLETWTMGA